jgi:flagellar hook-associated protein FlgK
MNDQIGQQIANQLVQINQSLSVIANLMQALAKVQAGKKGGA